MNLIESKWIAVRREDGQRERIAPWQVTATYDRNPIVAFDLPRPDFNGAMVQFLIGLLQSTFAPVEEVDWTNPFMQPPTPKALRKAFASIAHAFDLGGAGPRFMQDSDPALLEGEGKPIANLLIEAPGRATLRDNKDHFIKRGGVVGLCAACAATAIYALQTNAPVGGVGHRTSLRGGGPLTTLVLGRTLWETLWLAVLPNEDFLDSRYANADLFDDATRFPWMGATRTSEARTGSETTPQDVHPHQYFWAMPRRIHLDEPETQVGDCDLCGASAVTRYTRYFTRNYGINYTGPWKHPLTPYTRIEAKEGGDEWVTRKGQRGGIGYRHWLGLVQHTRDQATHRAPATVVDRYLAIRQEVGAYRLWAFGYDMDQMTALGWCESTMPLNHIPRENREEYEWDVAVMVQAADKVASNLRKAVKSAWFKRPGDHKGDTTFIDHAFWHDTESVFHAHREQSAKTTDRHQRQTVRQRWHQIICRQALSLFDHWATHGPIEDGNPRRIYEARRDMLKWNHGQAITETLLGIPAASDKRAG